ncbi:ZIP family metal transporter [Chryseolinea soli]|uniref:Zinc permease n=1 Tax=Chryseolinea soli TaxID=2321403 RepID=A0A385SHD8_9BACT|nr:ZIP family metal transporter [Chryseolinea soli]AYB31153.1 zinc permease [Chryseolinea soli]
MILKLLVLFLTPLLSGLLIYLVPKSKGVNYKLLLVFSGSYLFSITVIHILPELYKKGDALELIGLFVLAGFFLQHLLEYFTSGVEHGHIHTQPHQHGHHLEHQRNMSALVLLAALCIHAFLEGGMLAQPVNMGPMYDVNAVLLGIALHRAPAAFALMTVLAFQLRSKNKALPHLIGFSLAAPAGLILSTLLARHEILTSTGLMYLYALVSGNFLHISTTIVVESSPEHHFNARKMAVVILGALLALAAEFLM